MNNLEKHFGYLWQNPPEPFNPHAVHETKEEQDRRHEAYEQYSDCLPADMPEDEKRALRGKFYREYWDAFTAKKRGSEK